MTINYTIYLRFSGFDILLKTHHNQQIFNKKILHKKLITKLTNCLQIVDLTGRIAVRRKFVSRHQFRLLCNFLLTHTTSIYKRNDKRLAVVYKNKDFEQENNLPFCSEKISNKFKCQQFLLHKKGKRQKQNPQNKNCFNILKTINNCLNDKNLLEPNSSILLSISGGQDSICLFFLFEILKIQWNWKISIIYCNHLWQKDSFETQNQICKMGYYFTDNIYFTAIPGQTNGWHIVSINPNSLSIPFGTYFLKLPNHQKLIFSRKIAADKSKICSQKWVLKKNFRGNCSYKSSICRQLTCFTEQKARNWRYQLWQKLSVFYKYNFLITGHTATDRAETLLLNLIRGSGKRGVTSLQWNKKILKMFSCFFFKKQENIFKTTFLGYKKQFNVEHSYRFLLIASFKNKALQKLQLHLFMYFTFLNYKKNKLEEYIVSGQKIHLPAIAYQPIVAIRKKLATNRRFEIYIPPEKYANFLFFSLSGEFVARNAHKKSVHNFTYRNAYFQILRQFSGKNFFLVPPFFRFVNKILFWAYKSKICLKKINLDKSSICMALPPSLGAVRGCKGLQIFDLLAPNREAKPLSPLTAPFSPLQPLNNLLIRNCRKKIYLNNDLYPNLQFVQGSLSLKFLLNLGRKYKLYLYSSNRNCNHNKCERDLPNLKQKYVTSIKINLYRVNQKLKINQQLKFTYIYKKFISSPQIS